MKIFTSSSPHVPKIQCDVCILVYNDVVLHAKTQNNVVAQDDESILRNSPTELASAARRLLPENNRDLRVVLALPNDEFVATQLKLPAAAQKSLHSTLQLQLPTLLPGQTEPLLLATQPPAHADDETVALWLPQKKAIDLFDAFKQEGLFLNAILPRALLTLPKQPAQILDEDKHGLTHVVWTGKTVKNWLHTSQSDYTISAFQQQFDEQLSALHDEKAALLHKEKLADWDSLPMPHPAIYAYAFIPPQATQADVQKKQQRHRRYGLIAAMLFLFAIGIAAGAAIYYKQQLEQQLQNLKSQTLDISRLQAEVVTIEDDLAPVEQFPRQNMTAILHKLSGLIPKPNSWLTSILIEEGAVEIEGYSPNPAELVEILASDERFTEVAFSRSTRKDTRRAEDSFGIRFNLAGVDLQSYLATYFGTED